AHKHRNRAKPRYWVPVSPATGSLCRCVLIPSNLARGTGLRHQAGGKPRTAPERPRGHAAARLSTRAPGRIVAPRGAASRSVGQKPGLLAGESPGHGVSGGNPSARRKSLLPEWIVAEERSAQAALDPRAPARLLRLRFAKRARGPTSGRSRWRRFDGC